MKRKGLPLIGHDETAKVSESELEEISDKNYGKRNYRKSTRTL